MYIRFLKSEHYIDAHVIFATFYPKRLSIFIHWKRINHERNFIQSLHKSFIRELANIKLIIQFYG